MMFIMHMIIEYIAVKFRRKKIGAELAKSQKLIRISDQLDTIEGRLGLCTVCYVLHRFLDICSTK